MFNFLLHLFKIKSFVNVLNLEFVCYCFASKEKKLFLERQVLENKMRHVSTLITLGYNVTLKR